MVRQSVLNDCLNNIVNAEKAGKRQVLIRPSSKVIIKFLEVMQKHGKSSSSLCVGRGEDRMNSSQVENITPYHRTDNSTRLIPLFTERVYARCAV